MSEWDDDLPVGWSDAPVEIGHFAGQRANGTEWSYDVDKALWVEMDGERGYIVGNAHTHRGRFRVCFPERTEWVAMPTSVYELTAMSREARYWLRGFLIGYEPDIDEYLGREELEGYDPTPEEWVRYEDFLEHRYLRYGTHGQLNLRPDRALAITDEERAEITVEPWHPWSWVGERVLIPDGAQWVEADPQPAMDGPWPAGSICAGRGHCSTPLVWLDSGWSVCAECGQVDDRRHLQVIDEPDPG